MASLIEAVRSCTCGSVMPTLPFSFTVPRSVLSQNKTTYAHWSVHHKDKKDWLSLLRPLVAPLIGRRLPWSRWSLVRTYGKRAKLMDFANLVGGAKPLVDCLVELKIIVDDSPVHFECVYAQERRDVTSTVITLLEIR